MSTATLSILIPLYNEEEFIAELLRRVVAAPLPDGLDREIIVVDDSSTDDSVELVEEFINAHPEAKIRLLRQVPNRGKGAAIRMAIDAATGEFSVIQDADLEYNPNELGKLMGPLLRGDADAVFGSRFLVANETRVLYFWHSVANGWLTLLCNIACDLNLTDMETCYKAFRTVLVRGIPLTSERFGMEPELTIKLARRKARIYETSISYHGRTYEEGKKIGLSDAFDALWVILRSRFTSRIYREAVPHVLETLSVAPRFNGWMADTISPFIGARVLEIGAGMGNLTRKLCRRRKLYVATDMNPEYVEQLRMAFRHRPLVRVARFDTERPEDFPAYEGAFDTVICLHVLEHLADDASALVRIGTLLQPGGRLILLVPNDPSAYGSLDAALGHQRRYASGRLKDLVEKAGYEVEKVLDFNRISTPGWHFTGKVLRTTTVSTALLKVFDRLVWLWRRIDSALPWQPMSLIVIARRRAPRPVR
jgi:glycosyltransferase involved in cell wall biosynthesis/phospholipid N-methyltransferase